MSLCESDATRVVEAVSMSKSARKLKALKTHTILLTWDPANTGSTSRFLSEEVCTHIDIMKQAGNDPDILRKITISK